MDPFHFSLKSWPIKKINKYRMGVLMSHFLGSAVSIHTISLHLLLFRTRKENNGVGGRPGPGERLFAIKYKDRAGRTSMLHIKNAQSSRKMLQLNSRVRLPGGKLCKCIAALRKGLPWKHTSLSQGCIVWPCINLIFCLNF